MAEHVQAALDQMVAPLLDLQERQIFTAEEIHSILKRRRESEYALRRRQSRKADFIDYIQSEMRLEKLRELRTKRLKKEQSKDTKTATQAADQVKNIGDKHILQHLHLLWTRTLRKYRSDLSLWLQYADFCKSSRSGRKLSALYAQAVQFHPLESGLWVEAANHEWEQSHIPNARVLLQRGLRVNNKGNDKAKELWLQSFALELHVVQKLSARRKVLQSSTTSDDSDNKATMTTANEGDTTITFATTCEDPYQLARIVFDHASRAVPGEVAFHLSFLQQCRFFPDTEQLEAHILQRILGDDEQQHGNKNTVDAWISKAQWVRDRQQQQQQKSNLESTTVGFLRSSTATATATNTTTTSALEEEEEEDSSEPDKKRARPDPSTSTETSSSSYRDPVLQVLRQATKAVAGEEMYLQTIRFVLKYREEEEEEEDDDDSNKEECSSFLETMWQEALDSDFFSADLVLEYVAYLGDETERAMQVLKEFVDQSKNKSVPTSIWFRLAVLQQSTTTGSWADAIETIELALKKTPVHEADHLILLLQLLGAQLKAKATSVDEHWLLIERLLLLYPGFARLEDLDDPPFGIKSVPHACLEFLKRVKKDEGLEGARRLYGKLFFQSGFGKEVAKRDPELFELILNESIEAESKCALFVERKRNLLRLYNFAILHVQSKATSALYRTARDDLQFGTSPRADETLFSGSPLVPTFDASTPEFSSQTLLSAYRVFQIVHLRNVRISNGMDQLSWKGLGAVFQSLGEGDQESWCVETKNHGAVSSSEFLKPELSSTRAYCSFLVQKDKAALKDVLSQLPITDFTWASWSYEPALWVFFGRNSKGPDLEGRPEHTDSVSHDGTWHFQLSGRKKWNLRPSCDMLKHLNQHLPHRFTKEWTEDTRLSVECCETDIIIVNTKLWFHQTIIPPQKLPSVSYARDFRLQAEGGSAGGMTNVDGLYATTNLDEGTIVFTEKDMPDAELRRSSTNANCKVVVLEDGTSAVVSSRSISAGEFFCVSPSDDESDDDDDDYGDNDNKDDDEEVG